MRVLNLKGIREEERLLILPTLQINTVGISPMATFCTISRWQRIQEPRKLLHKLDSRWATINQIWVLKALLTIRKSVPYYLFNNSIWFNKVATAKNTIVQGTKYTSTRTISEISKVRALLWYSLGKLHQSHKLHQVHSMVAEKIRGSVSVI